MDEGPRPGRRQRWLALGIAGLGAVVLVWALAGFLRVALSERAAGDTAGGAATLAELCRRSVPAELAEACIAAGRQRSVARRRPLERAAALGVALVVVAIGVGSVGRQRRNPRRRNG